MKKVISSISLLLFCLVLLSSTSTVAASTTCTFTTAGTTMTLDASCSTDATLLVPDGYTLDGNGHTITAVDPDGGHFVGAVVKNDGTTAHVTNLTITTDALVNTCDGGDDRLRGILFEGASGSITHSTVLELNQGNSGCQEGNAIEVRNAPYDGTHPNTQSIYIAYNYVDNYQKGGIIANGDVDVVVEHNEVDGFGPINFIAQNGIQLGFGAGGAVYNNEVTGNVYTPATFASSGILVYLAAENTAVLDNEVSDSDVGIWLIGSSYLNIQHNQVSGSTYDGIALDDQGGAVHGGFIFNNISVENVVGIGLYGATTYSNTIERNFTSYNSDTGVFSGFGAYGSDFVNNKAFENETGFNLSGDDNLFTRNTAQANTETGILVDGNNNSIIRNQAKYSGLLDIDNTGTNTYNLNKCDTSTGAPVDCGYVPSMPSSTPLAPTNTEAESSGRTLATPFE